MATRMMNSMMSNIGELRFEPTQKRVRAKVDGHQVVDSTRAALLWEPRRFVPSYAVPADDVSAEMRPSASELASVSADVGVRLPGMSGPALLTPRDPFHVHTAEGEALDMHTSGRVRETVGFRLSDTDLAGYVSLDFAGFDEWYEEEERIVSHPRDPFHRVDLRESSRQVRMELDGTVLAQSDRPLMVFETGLPVRFYLRRDDVQVALTPTATRTSCAYKGEASYWSVELDGRVVEDLAWSYPAPLRDAADLLDLVCFFDEKIDLVVDGVGRERPVSPWS